MGKGYFSVSLHSQHVSVVGRPLPIATRKRWTGAGAVPFVRGAKKKYVITTPLFFCNADPHLGDAYTAISVDVAARFQRMRGREVTFITGTIEHGEKIAAAADKAGVAPQVLCDRVAQRYLELWEKLDISYDRFIRTTAARHEATVQAMLERMWQRGDIYKGSERGAYCVACEEYKDPDNPDDTDNDGQCLAHRTPCPEREQDNYFFALSKYSDDVQSYLKDRRQLQPERLRKKAAQWVGDGARDFSISRSAVEWGQPFPRDASHTVYAWADALIGNLSALLPETFFAIEEASLSTGDGGDGKERGDGDGDGGSADVGDDIVEALVSAGWPAEVHLVSRDVFRFYAVHWAGMLCSMGLPLPRRVYGHGLIMQDGLKMGKTLGNVVDVFQLTDSYGVDAVRFYFLKRFEYGKNLSFSETRLRDNVNIDLADRLSELVNRCTNLLQNHYGGVAPVAVADIPAGHPVRSAVATTEVGVADAYERLSFYIAIKGAMKLCFRVGEYMDRKKPWLALKKGSKADQLDAIRMVLAVLEAVRIVAVMLAPVIPALSRDVYRQLGMEEDPQDLDWWEATKWGAMPLGHRINKPKRIYERFKSTLLLL